MGSNLSENQDEAMEIERGQEELLRRRREQEDEDDCIKEQIQDFCGIMDLLKQQLEDTAEYPSEHRHLREIPGLQVANFKALVAWAQRRESLDSSRVMIDTWSRRRRGNMFK